MERLEFIRSRTKNFGLLLLGIALVAGCLFMATSSADTTDRVIGWGSAAFFSLAVVVALRNIIMGGTVFAFDSGGITDHPNSIVIPWAEIADCVVVSVRGTKFLGLTLLNPEQFLSRTTFAQQKLARFNERMGWSHWALSFSGVSPNIEEALEFIRRHAPGVRVPAV